MDVTTTVLALFGIYGSQYSTLSKLRQGYFISGPSRYFIDSYTLKKKYLFLLNITVYLFTCHIYDEITLKYRYVLIKQQPLKITDTKNLCLMQHSLYYSTDNISFKFLSILQYRRIESSQTQSMFYKLKLGHTCN